MMSELGETHILVPDEKGFLHVLKRIVLVRPTVTIAALFVGFLALVALFAPWLAPHDPLSQSYLTINVPPSPEHWLGTDQYGRDVLSRIIYGTRTSLVLGLLSPFLAAIVGTTLGVIAGYFGGIADRLISRGIDLLLAFPELLLAILIAAVLGPGFWNVVVVLTVAFVPGFARVARASTLSVRNEPFVEAAVAVGVRTPLVIFRHVVPNITGNTVVLLTLWTASAIRLEATLSFLGIGTQQPQPSWGNIIRDGLNNIFGTSWPIFAAGAAITVTVLAINLVGDAVRDELDPEIAE